MDTTNLSDVQYEYTQRNINIQKISSVQFSSKLQAVNIKTSQSLQKNIFQKNGDKNV